MNQSIKLVIPARYASTRLLGKPLRLIAGKPLIQHVYEAALNTDLGEIIIATDDERIAETCNHFSADVCMTSSEHESGSDRLAEVVTRYNWGDDTIIINLQGDEPLTPASCLQQVAENLQTHPEASIATLATPLLDNEEYENPNIVKVVRSSIGMALYFSRANIPFQRENEQAASSFALRHLGIYAYRAKFLKDFASMEQSPIEKLEKLEQLRAMWHGKLIHVDIAKELPGHGVDTEEDLQAIEQLLS